MNIDVSIQLPNVWGGAVFQRDEWGAINFCVGPNGSGKSLFAEQLKDRLQQQGFQPRLISADRLMGLERYSDYWGQQRRPNEGLDIGRFQRTKDEAEQKGLVSDSFILIREKLDIRIRIEAFLSTLFKRRIRLIEQGGFLVPKIINVTSGAEYDFRSQECHGLKELISLLAYIYDDEKNCLLIDEPELHLHPQFQSFFIAELRKIAGDPRVDSSKKLIFLFTHSPYFLDIRSLDDLKNFLVFQGGKPPTAIGALEAWEEVILKRLLPRLNTHHKQFFFSSHPVFVEGYTDCYFFSALQYLRGVPLGANGATFIDVGGTSELELFLRLSRKLGLTGRVIADLDSLFDGRLRDAIGEVPECSTAITNSGLGASMSEAIQRLVQKLDSIHQQIQASNAAAIGGIKAQIVHDEAPRRRYRTLLALIFDGPAIKNAADVNAADVDAALGMLERIREAAAAGGNQILPKGALENHLPAYTGDRYKVDRSLKPIVLADELEFLASNPTDEDLRRRYSLILPVLDSVIEAKSVDPARFVSFSLGDWIASVQRAFDRGEVTNLETLRAHPDCMWNRYRRIMELLAFNVTDDQKSFTCRGKLRSQVDITEREFQFGDMTLHAKFRIPD